MSDRPPLFHRNDVPPTLTTRAMGHLLRWFVFGMAFGLLPFAFSVLLRVLHGEPPALAQAAPELLFAALMLSSVQMGEAVATAPLPRTKRIVKVAHDVSFCALLLIAILSAVVYGVYVEGARTFACAPGPTAGGPGCAKWVTLQSNVFSLCVWTAAGAAVVGTFAELMRTRRKRWIRLDRG